MGNPLLICSVAVLALTAPLAPASDSSDAVNERIPVKKLELEKHWRVDCARAWETLHSSAESCQISAELQRQIKLCAFIYQAPGDSASEDCPDYREASERLRQLPLDGDCRGLGSFLQGRAGCHRSKGLN